MDIKTSTAGGIVVNKEGRVLVVNQKGISWSLPKGHIDAGEDELAAAKREIYEESGISDLTLIKKLGTYERYKIGLDTPDDTSELKVITIFLFTTGQMELTPQDADNPEARWVAPKDVADLLTHAKDRQFYQENLDEIPHTQK